MVDVLLKFITQLLKVSISDFRFGNKMTQMHFPLLFPSKCNRTLETV